MLLVTLVAYANSTSTEQKMYSEQEKLGKFFDR